MLSLLFEFTGLTKAKQLTNIIVILPSLCELLDSFKTVKSFWNLGMMYHRPLLSNPSLLEVDVKLQ